MHDNVPIEAGLAILCRYVAAHYKAVERVDGYTINVRTD
jgi:hypothetical protein